MITSEHYFERLIGVSIIGLLSFACLRVLWPFLGAILWAVILVVATWPLYVKLDRALGYRPRRTTMLMTFGLASVLIVPIAVLTVSLSEHVVAATYLAQDLTTLQLPATPPSWVSKIPLLSAQAEEFWKHVSSDTAGAVEKIRPQIKAAATWLLSQGANLGLVVLLLIVTIAIAALLYANALEAAEWVKRFAIRVGGAQSADLIGTAAQTVRSVSLGVVGTAALQASLTGLGFWAAGVPGTMLLTFFSFFTAMLQLGTGPAWIPVAIFLGYHDQDGWALFTIILGIFVNLMDGFIRPYLISQGSGLPLALIFMGVIGGLLTWGPIGIFLGPTLLATGFTILKDWLEIQPEPAPDPGTAD